MSQFKCPECGFIQGYLTLSAHSGQVGDSPRTEAACLCPNDGAKLLPWPEHPLLREPERIMPYGLHMLLDSAPAGTLTVQSNPYDPLTPDMPHTPNVSDL